MSCEYVKFVGITAEQMSRLMAFIANEKNTGREKMYLVGKNGAAWAKGTYPYQHVTLLEAKPANSPGHLNVHLLIQHYFVPTDDRNSQGGIYLDESGLGWHMEKTGAPMPVALEIIDGIHEALGIFPREQVPMRDMAGGGELHSGQSS